MTQWHAGSPRRLAGTLLAPTTDNASSPGSRKTSFPLLQLLRKKKREPSLFPAPLAWEETARAGATRKQSEGVWRKQTAVSGCGAGRLAYGSQRLLLQLRHTLPSQQLPKVWGGFADEPHREPPPWKC